MKYPNQKCIVIHRTNPLMANAEKKQYIALYTENIAAASRNLTGEVPFKFFLYLAANADKYNMNFSPQHFSNIYGVSVDAARKAVLKLVEAGYLVPSQEHKNTFEFYEVPQLEEEKPSLKIKIQEEVRLLEQDNGEFVEMTYTQVYNELKADYPEDVIKQIWNSAEVR